MSAELAIIIKATNQARAALREAGNDVDSLGAKLGKLGTMAVAGAAVAGISAIGGALVYSVDKAADFEKAMSGIKAVTGASKEEMDQMSVVALQLGKDTSFSAKEAAEGIGELAKGGVSVADIMGGAAKSALDLAAAGGVEVADAAALAANAMAVFNIEGKDTAKVADAIAGFANATTGSVNDFKFSLAAAGSAAHAAGQDFDQTAVAIGLLGKQGILGSDAGTSLKTFFLNLQNGSTGTKEQIALFKELGLATNEVGNNFINADGSFKDLRDIAAELNTAFSGLTEAQTVEAAQTLFGNDAFRAATVLAEAGAEGWDKMTEAMLTNVTASDVAATRLDNLRGSQEQMNGSVETAAIILGKNFTPALKDAADMATKFLNDSVIPLAETSGPELGVQLQQTGVFLGQVGQAMAPIANVIGIALRATVDAIGQSLDSTTAFIYAAAVAFVHLKDGIGEFFDAVGTKVHEIISAIQTTIQNLGPTIEAAARSLGASITAGIAAGLNPGVVIDKLRGLAGDALQAAKDRIEAHSPSEVFAKEVGLPIALGIAEGVLRGTPDMLAHIRDLVGGATDAAEQLVNQWRARMYITGGLRGPGQASPNFGDNPAAIDLLTRSGFLTTGAAAQPNFGPNQAALDLTKAYQALAPAVTAAATAQSELSRQIQIAVDLGKKAKDATEVHRSALDGFRKSILDLVTSTDLKKKFGELGLDIWGNLEEAITTKAYGAGSKVANALQRMVEKAREMGVKNWAQLGDDLMAAALDALTTGSQAAKDKVAELISLMNDAIAASEKIKSVSGNDKDHRMSHAVQTLPSLGIKAMASGGIVTRPTFALIGEHGPEAVVPLGQTGNVHVHLEGAQIYGVGDLDERVRRAVSEGQRRGALAR